MRLSPALALAGGLALSAPAFAQTNPAAPAVSANPYPTPLYRMTDVGKSLNLTPDQVTRLNTLTDQTQAQFRSDYTKAAGLAEAERMVRMAELNRQYNTAWNKAAAGVFNDAQRARYQQFNYQYGGFNTLSDPDVQRRLNLTPEQVRNLNEHAAWSDRQWQDVQRAGAADPTKGTQAYRDYWTARQERFNKFLTPDQQKAWREMAGEPYTFQPNFSR
jgi:hypothetical protein